MKLDAQILERLKGKPGEVTDETFGSLVEQAQGAVVVDFWADYCAPCHMLMPLVYKLAHEYAGRVTVLKMDTEANHEVFERLKLQGVPTLLFYLNGERIDEVVGYGDGGYCAIREKFETLAASAGHPVSTDTRELAFEQAIADADAGFDKALEPAQAVYMAAAEPFREAIEAATKAADADFEAGRLDQDGLRAAYNAAYAPMQEATKAEAAEYRAAASVANEARAKAISAAIEAYLG